MSGFDTDSDSDPDTDEASPMRSMMQSKTRNLFGIKTQDISTAYLWAASPPAGTAGSESL
ncbi:MAG TPA: hypothetical protein DIW77_19145 [Chromatiaceae bacterium]|nr:hypothetical protein [Chromatiaceae bacterium]